MKLSMSVRIAEGFLSKEIPILSFKQVVHVAKQAGYSAICMRASQLGITSQLDTVVNARALLNQAALRVSMVTGDFDMVYNNERGPMALRNIEPYLALAKELGASMVRVALKGHDDIPWAKRACDLASSFGIRLVHQCHTLSLFESVDSILETLCAIDRPNFGLIFEPANLQICGQDYGTKTVVLLAPWIFNVYLQNQVICEPGKGSVTLDTWCRGPVSFDVLPIHKPGSIDFQEVVSSLHLIDYEGYVTVHQSVTDGETPEESAIRTADYLRSLMAN